MNEFFNTVPPSDKDLEKATLWAMITNPHLLGKAKELNLSPESFYVTNHAATFSAICELENKGEPVDFQTVRASLGSNGEAFKDLLGHAQNELGITSATRFETQCRRLKRYQHTRRMIAAMRDSLMRLYVDKDFEKEMATIEGIFAAIYGDKTGLKMRDIQEIKADFIQQLQVRINAKKEQGIIGIPYNNQEFDKVINGWQGNRLYMIAARPAMGKTESAVKAMLEAKKAGYKAAFLSAEMSDIGIFQRAMSQYMEFYKEDFERGTDNLERNFDSVREMADLLAADGVMIDESCPKNKDELIARCKHLIRKGADLIIIDYLGLIGSDNKNKNQALGEITRALKVEICKELDTPVLLLHQLSRAVETRGGDKRPILSDLRDSGEIEQDADVVIFLYRPEYYGFETDEEGNSTKGYLEFIVAKNRHGRTGIVKAHYNPAIGIIGDWGYTQSAASAMMPGLSQNGFSGSW